MNRSQVAENPAYQRVADEVRRSGGSIEDELAAIAEELARRVVANGGRVLALPADRLPGGAPITAVLRYAQ